ncbi:MAG TPA: transglutaminase-like domain-containing protein [Acidimicrobiales bacterium]|nr:transglutaminase-like domain-containing protein [Acidimicrobiales bacterium]
MATPEELRYYSSQSRVTDPGQESALLGGLPSSIAGLRRAAQGLVAHYRGDDPLAHGVSPERMAEIDTRYAEAMLARLAELDDGGLVAPRPLERRLVGCCRDFTVLFLTMARAMGIAGRARVGFASYFFPGYFVDHVVAEVWDAGTGRWRLVDPQLHEPHTAPSGGQVDPMDVSPEDFLIGGEAWRRCRSGLADPGTFVVSPFVDVAELRGWPYLRHNVVLDLAFLNKVETLLWDSWGLLEQPDGGEASVEQVDSVAALTAAPAPDLARLQAVFADPSLAVPATVVSYDPLGGPPRTVTLKV